MVSTDAKSPHPAGIVRNQMLVRSNLLWIRGFKSDRLPEFASVVDLPSSSFFFVVVVVVLMNIFSVSGRCLYEPNRLKLDCHGTENTLLHTHRMHTRRIRACFHGCTYTMFTCRQTWSYSSVVYLHISTGAAWRRINDEHSQKLIARERKSREFERAQQYFKLVRERLWPGDTPRVSNTVIEYFDTTACF